MIAAAAVLVGLAAVPSPKPVAETPAARAEARRCVEEEGEKGIAPCRQALALGLGPEREAVVRQALGLRLAALARWDDLAESYREATARHPEDADAWLRLGQILLLALHRPGEAEAALRESVRLKPGDAPARIALALAMNALGRHPEAVALFEEARELDAAVLEGRPAAQAAYEAAKRGEVWP